MLWVFLLSKKVKIGPKGLWSGTILMIIKLVHNHVGEIKEMKAPAGTFFMLNAAMWLYQRACCLRWTELCQLLHNLWRRYGQKNMLWSQKLRTSCFLKGDASWSPITSCWREVWARWGGGLPLPEAGSQVKLELIKRRSEWNEEEEEWRSGGAEECALIKVKIWSAAAASLWSWWWRGARLRNHSQQETARIRIFWLKHKHESHWTCKCCLSLEQLADVTERIVVGGKHDVMFASLYKKQFFTWNKSFSPGCLW